MQHFQQAQCADSNLSFVIRVPHSPRPDAKAVWSLAVSWDASSASTQALFESVSDADIRDVREYLAAEENKTGHPLFLLTMLLDLLVAFYIEHRKELQVSLFLLEAQLGITRNIQATDAWSWDLDVHRETTKMGDAVYTGLVYLERRLTSALDLSHFILDCLEYCEAERLLDQARFPVLARASKCLTEKVGNNDYLVGTQLHQTLCLQKRCQALTSVVRKPPEMAFLRSSLFV